MKSFALEGSTYVGSHVYIPTFVDMFVHLVITVQTRYYLISISGSKKEYVVAQDLHTLDSNPLILSNLFLVF